MHTQMIEGRLTVIAESAAQTAELGRIIGAISAPGQCIALDGDLGVGKTELVRGLAAGAGVADISLVSSPTYVLLNVYPADGRPVAKTVFHLDAYRVAGPDGFDAVGWDDLLGQHAVIAVEWASRVAPLLPADTLHIVGSALDADSRRWTISAPHESARALLQAVYTGLTDHSPR
ncbi:MAG: tRNA (adenosine(37)-N6)-threonylcarbamoyltransferase complex ATPase subunit type 1 TsaE [Phycisphaerae bacterium]